MLLASPAAAWTAFRQLAAEPLHILRPVGVTVRETALAFGLALLLAVPVGVAIGSSRTLRRAYEPLFTSVNALPLIILYPVLAATLGIGSGSKTALGLLYAFFPIVITSMRATAHVDRDLLVAAAAMGAKGGQRIRSVVAPSILAPLFASMRVALGLALVTVIAAEFISGSGGVGYELGAASQSLDTPGLFAWIIVACLLTICINLLFSVITAGYRKASTGEDLCENRRPSRRCVCPVRPRRLQGRGEQYPGGVPLDQARPGPSAGLRARHASPRR